MPYGRSQNSNTVAAEQIFETIGMIFSCIRKKTLIVCGGSFFETNIFRGR